MKYIIITSGVCSSLGKGVASAAIASLAESASLKVQLIKCDPYINVDAANMDRGEHGEVFITEDGAESDGDLGHFYRFTSSRVSSDNCITIGKVYEAVIKNERENRYSGGTVQVIPHITDEIKRRIYSVGEKNKADIIVLEIGGTVGDIENIPYLEAVRQIILENEKSDVCSLHLTLVPSVTGGELKTKPTQHSVKQLQESGIQSDILLCRADDELDDKLKKKIALFCNVPSDGVFTSVDVATSIYELPILFHKQGLDAKIFSVLSLKGKEADVKPWQSFISRLKSASSVVRIALLYRGKGGEDIFRSLKEAVFHTCVRDFSIRPEFSFINMDSEDFHLSDNFDGVIINERMEKKLPERLYSLVSEIIASNIPYLGLDMGMFLMVPLTDYTDECSNVGETSAWLGNREVFFREGSCLFDEYKVSSSFERHCNKAVLKSGAENALNKNGIKVASFSDGGFIEAMEKGNAIGVLFHGEFASRPNESHPVFRAFIKKCVKK